NSCPRPDCCKGAREDATRRARFGENGRMSSRPIDPRVEIGHVHLRTADIQRVHDFYVGILGFEVMVRAPDALFVSAGGYHHHLAFNTWESAGGSPPPRGSTGLYHV